MTPNRYDISQAQRYELAERIGFFLVGKNLKTWQIWHGRLSKAEQIESFGFYVGKGAIEVDGAADCISMDIRCALAPTFPPALRLRRKVAGCMRKALPPAGSGR